MSADIEDIKDRKGSGWRPAWLRPAPPTAPAPVSGQAAPGAATPPREGPAAFEATPAATPGVVAPGAVLEALGGPTHRGPVALATTDRQGRAGFLREGPGGPADLHFTTDPDRAALWMDLRDLLAWFDSLPAEAQDRVLVRPAEVVPVELDLDGGITLEELARCETYHAEQVRLGKVRGSISRANAKALGGARR